MNLIGIFGDIRPTRKKKRTKIRPRVFILYKAISGKTVDEKLYIYIINKIRFLSNLDVYF